MTWCLLVDRAWHFCMQDSFVPGVTRRTVAEALERRFGASGGSTFRGRDLAGWYLQQARPPLELNRFLILFVKKTPKGNTEFIFTSNFFL